MKKVTIYTDGACSGNPGPGGWACILEYNGRTKEFSGFEDQATNNKMEILACLNALYALKETCEVDIYSDSAYVVKAVSDGWLDRWKNNGWLTQKKEPVLNKNLWLEMDALIHTHTVTFHKVEGHADCKLNNRCDELARLAIKNMA